MERLRNMTHYTASESQERRREQMERASPHTGRMPAPPRGRSRVTVGLDVARLVDYSALAINERSRRDDRREHHVIRAIERLPKGLSWQHQADRVADVIANLRARNGEVQGRGEPGFGRLDLVVDATGGGSAMIDLLKERGLRPVAVTITAGDRQVNHDDESISVGKSHLISHLQAWLEDRIHLPDNLEADVLIEELRAYEIDVTPQGLATFNARSGKHDDTVLALALATVIDVPIKPSTVFAIAVGRSRR